MRLTETLTNAQYVERVRELEAQGALYWTIKVLAHNLGYEISCVVPVIYNQPELIAV